VARLSDTRGHAAVRAEAAPGRLAKLLQRSRSVLASRRFPWAVVAFAMLLTSAALTLELTADDHFHSLALRDDPGIQGVARAPWDIFAFAKNPETNRQLMEEGVFPWWSDQEVMIAFLRPVTSLTHWLDHALWNDHPVLMHLHSMLWFAALLLVVGRLYQHLSVSPVAAGLAMLVYAIDDARAMTVGWISNRNALVALVPAFLALLAHHAWRSERKSRYAYLACASLFVGLFSGEVSIQVCGYLAAYALCLDKGTLRSRALSLLPYLGALIVWRVVYVSLGYGAAGSDFYIDPGRNPIAYTQNMLQRLPVLLLAQFGVPFADLWDAYPVIAPSLRVIVPIFGVLAMGLLAWLIKPLLSDARLRFWCVGTVLATLPVCSASPSDRLLTATGVGGAAVVATLLASFLTKTYPVAAGRFKLGLVACLGLVHLVLAPLLLPVRTNGVNVMENLIARSAASIPADQSIADKTLILLNPPAEPFAGYLPLYRQVNGIQRPKHFHWLATGITAFDLTRVDARSLQVRPEGGFLRTDIQWLFRSRSRPFHQSERIKLQDLTIEITELTPDGRPAAIVAHFDESLDSKKLEFMQWGRHDYVPFKMPAVGQSVHIPKVDLGFALSEEPKRS
jgi:hypothetical protein